MSVYPLRFIERSQIPPGSHPRTQRADAGVVQALRVYREWVRSEASMAGLVFVSPNGDSISKYGLAELLRAHLEAVGLKQERPELFVTNAERHRMRVHDDPEPGRGGVPSRGLPTAPATGGAR